MKIITIIGARPQFIKAAVVSRAIAKNNEEFPQNSIQEIIIHTGQHYDDNMSAVFFKEMQIPKPQYHLDIGGGTHGAMTGRMLEQVESILLKEKPDIVLVYGDTNSTLAGALAAAKLHIPVAHIEAGLRSFNMQMPEEINRILTDKISKYLFCPTDTAMRNLALEGVSDSTEITIANVGDVMYDAAFFYQQMAQTSVYIAAIVQQPFYLATVHRAENTDTLVRIKAIIAALGEIAERISVILPLHPRTRKVIAENGIYLGKIQIIDPVGYLDMMLLLKHCLGVFTDSGGVQKEAYFFRKACVTLRDETEWRELVEHGFNVLVGADQEKILQAESQLRTRQCDFSMNLYGDGQAGERIVQYLCTHKRIHSVI